jgi:ATP-GRASP peptide maturase of grasp-with-spasm system
MILVLSQRKYEPSTERVIDWISFLKGKFIRINGDDVYDYNGANFFLGEVEEAINIKNRIFDISNLHFNIGWYRRWTNQEYAGVVLDHNISSMRNGYNIVKTMTSDDTTIKSFLLNRIRVKKWLTHPFKQSSVNKLIVLEAARKNGLKIPETIICTNKTVLLKFFQKFNRIITKDITAPFQIFIGDGHRVMSKTVLVDIEMINQMPDVFLPTLFQNYVDKEFELRVFVFDNRCYTMAIFSQGDEMTEIDFRNYNFKKPNRTVPYKLPEVYEKKIFSLLESIGLETGSVDIIKTRNGEFLFLEVNPIGQFGMTSYPCNYAIERKIAEYLIKNDQ